MRNREHNLGQGGIGDRGRGFTMIEILMVIVILGILAALALPKFSDASHTARENTLKDELRYLRTQIVVFKAQHRDVPPGYPAGNRNGAPSSALFLGQMTQSSDELGNPGAASDVYKFGPYLSKMPPNPLNGLETILVVADGGALPAADNSTGWIFKPSTQEIIPNVPGTDTEGTRYVDY